MTTVLIVFLILIIIYLIITFVMFIFVCRKIDDNYLPMEKIVEETIKPYKEIVQVGNDWINKKYENNEIKDVYIKSDDNLKLHGIFIENKKSKGIIIESHGYRSSAMRDLFASCHEYYKLGYSLLLIDHRTSNESEGKYITFGIKECKDIINWIKFINKKYPKSNIILAGISMGASSVLMSLKYVTKKMNVKCILVDSGYINACDEISYCITHYFHIPGMLFINAINMWSRIFAHCNLKSEDTLSSLSKSKLPILFAHGLNDDFVRVENTKINYDNYKGIKELMLFENATHGISYLVDSKRYLNGVKKFLSKYSK